MTDTVATFTVPLYDVSMNRKIIQDYNQTYQITKDLSIQLRFVWFAVSPTIKSKTFSAKHIGVTCYINGNPKLYGVTARFFDKPKSVPLTLATDKIDIKIMINQAFNDAYQCYLLKQTDLEATVDYFDRESGEGTVYIPKLALFTRIAATGLKGSKSWWPNLACTYLESGQKIIVDKLVEVSGGVTPIVSEGVKFDAEKWETVRKGNHSFTQRDDGTISGLFAD